VNTVFIVDVLRVYDVNNSLPQKIGKEQNQSIHTHYISEIRNTQTKGKKCLRNTSILNYPQVSTSPEYSWLNTNHLRNFRSAGLSQDKSYMEIINQKEKENKENFK